MSNLTNQVNGVKTFFFFFNFLVPSFSFSANGFSSKPKTFLFQTTHDPSLPNPKPKKRKKEKEKNISSLSLSLYRCVCVCMCIYFLSSFLISLSLSLSLDKIMKEAVTMALLMLRVWKFWV